MHVVCIEVIPPAPGVIRSGGHEDLGNGGIRRKFVEEYGILALSPWNGGIKLTKIDQNGGF